MLGIQTSTSSSATFMQAEVTAHQLEKLHHRAVTPGPPQPTPVLFPRTAVCQLPQVGCALIFPSPLHSTANSSCQETVSQIVALSSRVSLLLSVPGRPNPLTPYNFVLAPWLSEFLSRNYSSSSRASLPPSTISANSYNALPGTPRGGSCRPQAFILQHQSYPPTTSLPVPTCAHLRGQHRQGASNG